VLKVLGQIQRQQFQKTHVEVLTEIAVIWGIYSLFSSQIFHQGAASGLQVLANKPGFFGFFKDLRPM
jgi:hypothetical protein